VNGSQISNLSAGNYPYTVKDANQCSTSGSETLNQPAPLPLAVSASPQSICEGRQSTLRATGGLTYSWSNGDAGSTATVAPTQSQQYTVTASDAAGCTQSATVQVQVDPLPSLQPATDTLCKGEPFTPSWSASISSGTITSYTWEFGDQSTSAVATPSHRFVQSGTYPVRCTITSDRQCSTTAAANIRVFETPQASFDVIRAEGCTPVEVTLINTSTSTDGRIVSYTWTSADAEDIGRGRFRYITPGSHDMLLTVTTEYGCTDDSLIKAVATVHPRPVAGFDCYLDELNDRSTSLYLTDRSSHATTWSWDFGDGNSSTEQQPSHIYQGTGLFAVRQIVDNGFGCPDTLVKTMPVGPPSSLWVPDAFSPNGDGLNEIFTAFGTRVERFSMDIFDRFGERIFTTTDIERGWDGIVQGERAPEGVYVYGITYTNLNQSNKQLSGRVSLVR
jgi:gliding motility-associated-like protein